MVGLSLTRNFRPVSRLLTIARLPSIRPFRNARTAGSPGGLAKFLRKRNGPEEAVDLLIVENDPAQRLELFVFAFGLELAGASGEISQDHARLREFFLAVHEHRRFAHFVDVISKFGRALNHGTEEIDPNRLPIGANQIEHQRGAVGIAGLRETIKLKFGHGTSDRVI